MKTIYIRVGLAFWLSCSVHHAVAGSVRTVVLSGDSAIGTEGGLNFRRFSSGGTLNNNGQVAFQGVLLTGTGVDRGIWSEGGDKGLELIARSGSPAPGTESGVYYANIGVHNFSDNGRIVFWSWLQGVNVGLSDNIGIWKAGGGNETELISRGGMDLPGTESGVFMIGLGAIALNNNGQAAFWAPLNEPDEFGRSSEGIWSEGGGNGLELIARSGSVSPSINGDIRFINIDNGLALNDFGQVAFVGSFIRPGSGEPVRSGVWTGSKSTDLRLVLDNLESPPGTENGTTFSTLAYPKVNNNGQVAFWSRLQGNGIDSSNDAGLWSEGGGNGLKLLAREGLPAPGTGSNVNFGNLNPPQVINENGRVAFWSRLIGNGVDSSNDEGLWSEGGGSGLELVVREGSAAPGVSEDVYFGSFMKNRGRYPGLVLNGQGRVAFLGPLTGSGVSIRNDEAIFAEDRFGKLQLIVRNGDIIDVDDGVGTDLRTIARLYFFYGSGNQDGGRSGFNDFGQLAFTAEFIDGSSGIFVSNLVAVPEPATWVLLISGVMPMIVRYRK